MPDPMVSRAPSGLSDNAAGAIAYITFIPAIFFLIAEPYRRNRYVRFHSWQSIFLAIGAFAVILAVSALLMVALVFMPFVHLAIWRLIELAWLVARLVCILSAAQGKRLKLPVIGALAEQQAGK